MPELPEVETIARALRPHVAGRVVAGVWTRRGRVCRQRPESVRRMLLGKRVEQVTRRGKIICVHLDTGAALLLHMGMSGQLLLEDGAKERDKHVHAALTMEGLDGEIRLRDPRTFGFFRVVAAGELDADPSLSALGPEPFDIDAKAFAERLRRRKRAVKTALLDQKLIAGVGNIYADESLFLAGIRPTRLASRVGRERAENLHEAVVGVLGRAIEAGGSSIRDFTSMTGCEGNFQVAHAVYGKADQPCGRCGGTIRRVVLGGRSTHFCGGCQR